ncbi:hypothetical protein D3C76_1589780 [compost metagenome]
MGNQKRPQPKHKQIPWPCQQHIAEQGEDQSKTDPAPVFAGWRVVQPAEQRKHGQRFDQQAQQRGVHAQPVEKSHRAHQRQNQPAHDQLTEIAQSKESTGSTSGAHGCCEVSRRRPVPAAKA